MNDKVDNKDTKMKVTHVMLDMGLIHVFGSQEEVKAKIKHAVRLYSKWVEFTTYTENGSVIDVILNTDKVVTVGMDHDYDGPLSSPLSTPLDGISEDDITTVTL